MMEALHASLHAWIASNAAGVRDHVVWSTLILVALLAASMLPYLRPRTRYALVLMGVTQFLLPGGLLARALSRFAIGDTPLPALSITAVFPLPSETTSQAELLCVMAAVWMAGAGVVAFRAIATQLQWRRIIRGAGAASKRELEISEGVAGGMSLGGVPRIARCAAVPPVTAGWVEPVVLLPGCCAEVLDDEELRAVLAHELAHIERRHNLGGLVQSAALALFWFNPALWIARHRLQAEAEKDCDERVLDVVPDPPAYLSGMLKVSYGFIAPQPAGVSCMSTSKLKERMDHIMKKDETPAATIPHRLGVLIGVAAIALTVVASAGEQKAKPLAAGKDGVSMPKLLSKVQPAYPPQAREKRVQGAIVLSTVIDETGNVIETSVVKGIEGAEGKALEEAAAAAVKQWKFQPAMKDGKPVTVTYIVTVAFKLDCVEDPSKTSSGQGAAGAKC